MSDLRSSPHAGAQDHGGAPVPPELSMEWAQQLLAGYAADVVGAGGPILPHAGGGFMLGYLSRHNPLEPQELDLAKSNRLPYRFYLYLRRQWTRPIQPGKRDVFFLAGANMPNRQAVLDVGGFDEPTFFLGPVLVLALLGLSVWLPVLAIAALLVPHLLYPQGLRTALSDRRAECLLDAYVQLAQQGSDDLGFIEGLWRFRHLVREAKVPGTHARPDGGP